MKLSVLTENMASGHFLSEFGLSFFIEYDEQSILFDTGHTDVFLKNAERLNIDLDICNTVVLSHGHWDHGNGLKYLDNKKLICHKLVCHPDIFKKRYHKNDTFDIGLDLSFEELSNRFEIISSRKPYKITENIIFLGEIPRENSFESKSTEFEDENRIEDFVPDDSALAIVQDDKLIIVSGCAHSGICNIVEYAKKITGIKKIEVVIGGFHLKSNDLQTKKTIEYLKKQNINRILPSHCTELPALAAFYNEFKIDQVKTGMIFNF